MTMMMSPQQMTAVKVTAWDVMVDSAEIANDVNNSTVMIVPPVRMSLLDEVLELCYTGGRICIYCRI
jgi:hypothetical protein